MDTKQTIISAAIALVLVVGAIGLMKPANGQPGSQGQAGRDAEPQAGALSGPDIISSFLRWGGVNETRGSMAIAATSSYPCQIQAPAATSTLLGASIRVDSNPMGATVTLDISTTTAALNGFGSSTLALVSGASITTAAQSSYVWTPGTASTTARVLGYDAGSPNGSSPYTLKPNEWVSFRIATSSPSAMASYLSGFCTARFQVI